MISMYTKQEIIIRSYREGKSERCIARELSISRTTVKKYIEEYEEIKRTSTSADAAQTEYLSTSPVYKTSSRPKVKLTQEVTLSIDKLLELNRQKREQGLRKQLLKKKDILESLQSQGFDIGYTSVCNYISNKESRQKNSEAFIRQDYQPGEVCEFDWGEIKLFINGKQKRFQLAVFTSAYSNFRYAYIYQRQDTLAFMECHVRFFNIVGGVYHQMVYDNMRVAVSRFVGFHEKEPTRALLQLRGHYCFSHRFCNAYRGNEKGHVERSVEYVRRKAFGLKDSFNDLREAEQRLSTILDKLNATGQKQTGKTAEQMLQEEQAVLRSLPASELICAEQVQLRVDKYSTVCYGTNHYSVPDHLVGKFVDVSLLNKELRVYHESKCVATHKRSFDKQAWRVEIEHYLSTFKKKPGALPGSLALASNIYLKSLYQLYFQGEPRGFIDLLAYCRDKAVTEEKLELSVKRILTCGNCKLTIEKLRALLGNQESTEKLNTEDNISIMAKQQLSELTVLMNQRN